MAEGKKSFVLYSDLIHTVKQMPNDKAGDLFKHILMYVNDESPVSNDLLIQLTFEPIKQQFKRDLVKWEETKEGRSKAGLASAEARKKAKELQQNSTNLTNVDFVQQTSTNPTVNDNVNVNVTVNDKKENISLPLENDFASFWRIYNKKNDSKKCKEKFIKLPQKDIDKILEVVMEYVNSTPDVKYRKNPLTWLNGKCWNDIEKNEYSPSPGKPFGKTNQI